jgi:hypothetical protein
MNLYAYFIYFQTLIAPSLLLEIRSLWFNLTEANERMESRWQPAESVAAAARTCFAVNLAVKCRLFVSCLQGKSSNFSIKNPIFCTLKIWKLCDCIMKRSKESEQKKLSFGSNCCHVNQDDIQKETLFEISSVIQSN